MTTVSRHSEQLQPRRPTAPSADHCLSGSGPGRSRRRRHPLRVPQLVPKSASHNAVWYGDAAEQVRHRLEQVRRPQDRQGLNGIRASRGSRRGRASTRRGRPPCTTRAPRAANPRRRAQLSASRTASGVVSRGDRAETVVASPRRSGQAPQRPAPSLHFPIASESRFRSRSRLFGSDTAHPKRSIRALEPAFAGRKSPTDGRA